MTWWEWGIGAAVWLYLGLVAYRWDRATPDDPCLIGCLVLWVLVLAGGRPQLRQPWLPWEPKPPSPSAAERVAAAEVRSVAMEREAGLEFES